MASAVLLLNNSFQKLFLNQYDFFKYIFIIW